MRIGRLNYLAFVVGCFALAGSAFAHHGQVQYDKQNVTLHGTVTKLEWSNPHAILWLEVKNDKNVAEAWHLEILPLESMRRAGWTEDSIKPGDEVSVTGRPGKGGGRIMWLEYLTTSDGRRFGRDKNS